MNQEDKNIYSAPIGDQEDIAFGESVSPEALAMLSSIDVADAAVDGEVKEAYTPNQLASMGLI